MKDPEYAIMACAAATLHLKLINTQHVSKVLVEFSRIVCASWPLRAEVIRATYSGSEA